MLPLIQRNIESQLLLTIKELYPLAEILSVSLDIPSDPVFGEYTTNIALKSAKLLKKSPMSIAQEIVDSFLKSIPESSLAGIIKKTEVKSPGFINFYLTPKAVFEILHNVFLQKKNYGRLDLGQGLKVQVEFVSANPTGPLSVAHARQAVVGDALVNILNFIGFQAIKEFYVNDEGNQINLLGESVLIRGKELLDKNQNAEESLGKDHYQGEYVINIAQKFIMENKIQDIQNLEQNKDRLAAYAVDYLMAVIQKDLNDFRVVFDVWSHQSEIATSDSIEAMIKFLKEKDCVYESEGAVWFKSSMFGDDKDRVLQKSDGTYTYLTPDIVYHKNKYDRNFSKIYNIWGPDHHGYIPRIKAAVEAMGENPESLEVLIVQLATIYREGKAVSMSTRRGEYISLREIIDEVGVDAARFFFLMRHINAHLDFDLELAKKETPENPVYYIQYAHARIHSIKRKAVDLGLTSKTEGICLLKEKEELMLIKKLGQFSDSLVYCYQQRDPYALVSYLQELATTFHKFYDQHKVIDTRLSSGDTSDPNMSELSSERLALIEAVKIVLVNGLSLLGIETPQQM